MIVKAFRIEGRYLVVLLAMVDKQFTGEIDEI